MFLFVGLESINYDPKLGHFERYRIFNKALARDRRIPYKLKKKLFITLL